MDIFQWFGGAFQVGLLLCSYYYFFSRALKNNILVKKSNDFQEWNRACHIVRQQSATYCQNFKCFHDWSSTWWTNRRRSKPGKVFSGRNHSQLYLVLYLQQRFCYWAGRLEKLNFFQNKFCTFTVIYKQTLFNIWFPLNKKVH